MNEETKELYEWTQKWGGEFLDMGGQVGGTQNGLPTIGFRNSDPGCLNIEKNIILGDDGLLHLMYESKGERNTWAMCDVNDLEQVIKGLMYLHAFKMKKDYEQRLAES